MTATIIDPVRIAAWPDEVIDRIGQLPSSAYFEWLWLPRVGPSAAWAYRRLTSGLGAQPDGYSVSLEELAHWLGLGRGTGTHSAVSRTLRRLTIFHLAVQLDESTLGLRRRVPPLTQAQLKRLSPQLQRTHLHLIDSLPGAAARDRAS